jgi:predicted nucleic acid-binding protein
MPSLALFEIANVLLVAERRGRLSEADTSRFINLLDSLPIRVDQEFSNQTLGRILAIGRQRGLSGYDAAYLELAMREGLRLATRDKALREAALKCGVNVI